MRRSSPDVWLRISAGLLSKDCFIQMTQIPVLVKEAQRWRYFKLVKLSAHLPRHKSGKFLTLAQSAVRRAVKRGEKLAEEMNLTWVE